MKHVSTSALFVLTIIALDKHLLSGHRQAVDRTAPARWLSTVIGQGAPAGP